MTYEEREAIFSKEALNNEDIQKLFGVCRTEATNIMMQIKRKTGDRLGIKGRLHIEDYLKHFGIEANRYAKRRSDEAQPPIEQDLHEEERAVTCGTPLIRSKNFLGANA